MSTGEAALRREIGPLVGVLLTINATIGTGIFKVPARVARLTGSLSLAMAVWIAGGVIAVCGALTMAEVCAAMPRSGGIYEVLRRSYGATVAFVLGWTKIVLLIPAAVGSFARLAAEALASLAGWPPDATRDGQVAVAFLVACVLANLTGVRASALEQAALSVVKVLGVAVLAAAGLLVAYAEPAPAVAVAAVPAVAQAAPSLAGAMTALIAVMWTYDGWANVASLGGEVKQPGRTLPWALLGGTAVVVVVYLLANAGYARVLGLDGLRASGTGANMAAANLATATLGAAGRGFLSALILVSCVGSTLAMLMASPRLFVPLAEDGLFVRWLGHVEPRTGVPARAVAVVGVLGAAYVLVRSFEQLSEAFVVGIFPFYALTVLALFRLRRSEPSLPRPFRVPGYPVVPVVFLLGASALLVGALRNADRTTLLALAVVAAGVPLSAVWRRTWAS